MTDTPFTDGRAAEFNDFQPRPRWHCDDDGAWQLGPASDLQEREHFTLWDEEMLQ